MSTAVRLRDGPWDGYVGEDVSLLPPQELVILGWRYRKTSERTEVHDEEPGTERERKREGWVYLWDGCDPNGNPIR